jgi:HPt (histidine-containing phosphotransfer) domain-containing protein
MTRFEQIAGLTFRPFPDRPNASYHMLNPSTLNSRIDGLRQAYRIRIAAEAPALRHLADRQDVAALRESCHRLVGTAGSYGFDAVADAAKTLGAAIEDGCDIPAALVTALCRTIDDIAVTQ